MAIEIHPFANGFPPLMGEERAALLEDIQENGVQEQITLWKGRIVDGKNRYALAIEAGYDEGDLPYNELDENAEEAEVLQFVLSKNMHRRQLTSSQRAAVVVHMQLVEKHRAALAEGQAEGRALETVVKQTGCNKRYLQLAMKLRDGSPELFEQVRCGIIGILEAVRQLNAASDEVGEEDDAGPSSTTPTNSDDDCPEHLKDVFRDAKRFDKWSKDINVMIVEIKAFAAESHAVAYLDVAEVKAALGQARIALRFGKPHAVCPVCNGENEAMTKGGQCVCKDRGYMNKAALLQIQQ